MGSKKEGWKTPQIMKALQGRYPAPGFAFLTEVRNGTGSLARTSTDALAMSVYPSAGLALHGFEVKASRSDWLKEMRNPGKSQVMQEYCDRWWLVVGSASIVKDSELPETWGLLVPSGTGLKVKVDAPKLEPKEMGRGFVASILREASRVGPEIISKAAYEGRQEGIFYAKAKYSGDLERLREKVAQFEKASGVSIVSGWRSGTHIGEAVKDVLEGKHTQAKRMLQSLKATAQRIIEVVDAQQE